MLRTHVLLCFGYSPCFVFELVWSWGSHIWHLVELHCSNLATYLVAPGPNLWTQLPNLGLDLFHHQGPVGDLGSWMNLCSISDPLCSVVWVLWGPYAAGRGISAPACISLGVQLPLAAPWHSGTWLSNSIALQVQNSSKQVTLTALLMSKCIP